VKEFGILEGLLGKERDFLEGFGNFWKLRSCCGVLGFF
jgi:hypothetical protein